MELKGLLLVDKQEDWTSFDVVAKTRGIISRAQGKKVKVGHSGTLDPAATGLLVLAIGKATKQIPLLTKVDKTYLAEVRLGQTSSTDDKEGEITEHSDNQPSSEEIESALNSFVGEIEQVPPAFSAIKIDGKRAYKLARDGKEVEIEPRKVTINYIKNIEYEYPSVRFEVSVSSGTYIRSLARDTGVKLGTGAFLSGLRRTIVGDFSVQDALTMDELNIESIQNHLKRVD